MDRDKKFLGKLEKQYEKMFDTYRVPDNIRRTACLIMFRFTVIGTCDGMYICNTIAYESGCGDGQGNFEESARIDAWKSAKAIQEAYGCNISLDDMAELALILDFGRLDYSTARAGMLKDIRELKRQHASADPWRKNYLEMQMERKQKDMALLIETFGSVS